MAKQTQGLGPRSVGIDVGHGTMRDLGGAGEQLVKSRQRVADHGEVFTPAWLVDDMLDLVQHESERIDARVLEPACGSGNFLVPVLRRKLATVRQKYAENDFERRRHALFALMCIYGIELLGDNVAECREHLLDTLFDDLGRGSGAEWFAAARVVVEANVVHGDALAMTTWGGGPITFPEWAYLGRGKFQRRDFRYDTLTQVSSSGADFGDDMKFDVIVGNPPYQLGQSGGDAIGNFAMPVYQQFVRAAKSLEPRYVVMITPSRWFAGGRGLDEFRKEMLADRRLRSLVDYPDSRDVFAGVDIAGGASYFLWDASWDGTCQVTTIKGGESGPVMRRDLDEYDILVRYNEAVSILHRVLSADTAQTFDSLASRVSPIQPFSLRTNFRGAASGDGMSDPVLIYQNGGVGYVERSAIPRNVEWVDQWKVFVSNTASEHGGQADKCGMRRVFSRILVGGPGTACTETYLVASRFDSEAEAKNFAAYLRTRFVRFLVSLRTNTQHLYRERFAFVPSLPMDREWSDEDLREQYDLSTDEVAYIEAMIRPMELA